MSNGIKNKSIRLKIERWKEMIFKTIWTNIKTTAEIEKKETILSTLSNEIKKLTNSTKIEWWYSKSNASRPQFTLNVYINESNYNR